MQSLSHPPDCPLHCTYCSPTTGCFYQISVFHASGIQTCSGFHVWLQDPQGRMPQFIHRREPPHPATYDLTSVSECEYSCAEKNLLYGSVAVLIILLQFPHLTGFNSGASFHWSSLKLNEPIQMKVCSVSNSTSRI